MQVERRQADVAANAAMVETANRGLSITERRQRSRGLQVRFAQEYVRRGVEDGVTLEDRAQEADDADFAWRGKREYNTARSFERYVTCGGGWMMGVLVMLPVCL